MTNSTRCALMRRWSSLIAITATASILAACSPGGAEYDGDADSTQSFTQPKSTSDWSVVTTSDNGDGYVRFGDGTWQWLDQACIGQLRSGDVSIARVEWNTVSSLTQVSGGLRALW